MCSLYKQLISSNRLWDMRTLRPIRRFFGHQNTSRNHIKAIFGPGERTVVSGSEDGAVFLWDLRDGSLLSRLEGHDGCVYECAWNVSQSLLVSGGDDSTVRTWWAMSPPEQSSSIMTSSSSILPTPDVVTPKPEQ